MQNLVTIADIFFSVDIVRKKITRLFFPTEKCSSGSGDEATVPRRLKGKKFFDNE